MRLSLCPLALIRITDQGLKDYGNGVRQAGAARLCLVTIHPDYADDAGLLAHELLHVGRWWIYSALCVALLALAGRLAGSVELGGVVFPLWALAPAGIGVSPLLYAFWPAWRAAEEIAAYRVQAACYPAEQQPEKQAKVATFIAERYGLDITAAEALQQLKED